MPITLDGPRQGAASGTTRSLVVLLHGLGADGDDLMPLAEPLAAVLPDTAFVAPHAPYPCDMAPFGRQWFSLQRFDPPELLRGADAVMPALDGFITHELVSRGLAVDRLVLLGFSQGAMMALHLGLRRLPPPAGIVGLSGALLEARPPAPARPKPPVLLIHGEADEVVGFPFMGLAEAGLKAVGIDVETLAIPGLGHGIDEVGLNRVAGFLVRVLDGRDEG